jgi:hypothetical protein
MPGDHFWLCVELLAAAFDDDDESVDENLNIYEQRAAQLPAEKRAELKRQLTQIIGGLARISLRMQERDSH